MQIADYRKFHIRIRHQNIPRILVKNVFKLRPALDIIRNEKVKGNNDNDHHDQGQDYSA